MFLVECSQETVCMWKQSCGLVTDCYFKLLPSSKTLLFISLLVLSLCRKKNEREPSLRLQSSMNWEKRQKENDFVLGFFLTRVTGTNIAFLNGNWKKTEKNTHRKANIPKNTHERVQWNQEKMWLFLNNFSASTNWFWQFETLLGQSLNCLLFPEWNRIGIFCGNGGKHCPSPILEDF